MKKKILITIISAISLIIILFLVYCFIPVLFHDKSNLEEPGRIFLKDRNGIVITDKPNEYGYQKDIEIDFDSQFVKSLILIEDKRYFSHFGIDILAKGRALISNIRGGKIVSGGSTITEQYIKNEYFVKHKRSYIQKAREAVLAIYYSLPFLPNEFGIGNSRNEVKREVLASYLNNIYFGNNIYGVGGAIDVYFGKHDLNDLTEEEIVLLISILNNPSIKNLEEKQFPEYFEIVKERLGFNFERTIFELEKLKPIDKFPFVTNYLRNIGEDTVTIDAEFQAFVEKVINDTLDTMKHKNVTNAAVLAMNPITQEFLLYAGSRDFNSKEIDGQVNVLLSQRQPGSTMKPFLYLLALEEGAGVNSLILDIESQYNSFKEGTTYISENYSLKEYGLVRFKKALGNSFNNSSVRLARELGLSKVYNFYKNYGFDLPEAPEYYGYSLVLGNPSITLTNLVFSYSYLFDDMENDANKFLLYQILSNPDNRDISFGVNSILNTSIYQAVKTGTSSNFRDNLVLSYHPDLVIGVWVGNNDNSSMTGVTGISGAGYIWHQIVEEAIRLGYIKERKIGLPEGVEEKNYCLDDNCFRKEINYDKKDIEYYSRIVDGKYSERDVYSNLTQEEIEYLEVLGFRMTK